MSDQIRIDSLPTVAELIESELAVFPGSVALSDVDEHHSVPGLMLVEFEDISSGHRYWLHARQAVAT